MIEFIVTQKSGAEAVYNYLANIDIPKTLLVTVKEYRRSRSKEQNALIHVWFTYISKQYYLTHGELYSPNVWKEYLKKMILGEEVIDVPHGTITRTKRTRDLNVGQMTEFMEHMVIYCATEFEIILSGLEDR